LRDSWKEEEKGAIVRMQERKINSVKGRKKKSFCERERDIEIERERERESCCYGQSPCGI